jgi:hypothetical protein
VADGINLRLGRRDMNVFRTIDRAGERPVVHVAGRHPAALCPSCAHPSVDTNGTGWRDVIDVVRTLVITLSVCVRRFVCTNDACGQRTFDERFEGISRGGASERARSTGVAALAAEPGGDRSTGLVRGGRRECDPAAPASEPVHHSAERRDPQSFALVPGGGRAGPSVVAA